MKPTIEPIGKADISEVAEFLHANLGEKVPATAWARAMAVPWTVEAPNHGFLLRDHGRVVGAHLAFYSRREIDGQQLDVCNLGAWCVLPEYRFSGLRLLKAVLGQDGFHFTDLSPSGNVVRLNEKLGFDHLDTTTALSLNALPSLSRARVFSEPAAVESRLDPHERQIYEDHRRTAAARHAVIVAERQSCYVIFRHDRRKGLPFFVSILYASKPEVLLSHYGAFSRFALLRHRALATLCEVRVVGRQPRLSRLIANPRPKMYRSAVLRPQDVDYLYSELECLEW